MSGDHEDAGVAEEEQENPVEDEELVPDDGNELKAREEPSGEDGSQV